MTTELSDFNESVLGKLKTLPIEQQKQVSDFIDFLVNKYQSSKSESNQKSRIMGLFAGKGGIIAILNHL